MKIPSIKTDVKVATFIDGKGSSVSGLVELEVINPSTGDVLYTYGCGTAADLDRAVQSSRTAFEDGRWSRSAPSVKKNVLLGFADLVEDRSRELDALDAEEMGKPVGTAFCNAISAAELIRFVAESFNKISGDVFTSDRSSFVTQRRVPHGVVGAITPWNFPTFCAILKVAPALATGNSVVLKPSEMSSRSALLLARLAIEAGVPDGVFNVTPGLGQTVGSALALNAGVDLLTFTGSTSVGKLILQYAGQSNMKRVIAECGGKSPQIVFDDGVDIDAACDVIAGSILTNQGQICSVGTRLVVNRTIQKQMIEGIAARMQAIVVGNALDPTTTFGPLASASQQERVVNFVTDAVRNHIPLAHGGSCVRHDSGGYFVEPTIFYDVPYDARIAQEEIFGPVLSVIPFDTEDDAIRIANGTKYGLAATVWTASLSTGMRLAKTLHSTVVINSAAPQGEGAGFTASHEPAGYSGFGTEGGLAGIESYTRRQLMYFNHG